MFNRRSLLKCATGLFASIPFIGISKKSEDSTEFKADIGQDGGIIDLGKMMSTNVENQYDLEPAFELGTLHKPYDRHLLFPTISTVTIEYERGTEVWVAYNVPYNALTKFNFLKVFKTRKYDVTFENKVAAFSGPKMILNGYKYRLSNISIKGSNDELIA